MKNNKVTKIVYLGMFTALAIVLGFVNKLIPEMPQGGTVSIDIIAIFLCAYTLGVKEGVLCGICTTIVQFALGLASFWGPWSVALDYALPLAVCGLAPVLKNIEKGNITIYTGVILSMVLKFASHFASGAWLFGEYAPEGVNPMVYSFGYNLPYNLATLVVCLILMSIIGPRVIKTLKK